MAKPFVKSAGGKRTAAKDIVSIFRPDIGSYYELFLGGGAVFFKAQELGVLPSEVYLNEFDRALAELYRTVREDPQELFEETQKLVSNHSEEFYYQTRAEWNMRTQPRTSARLLYLRFAAFNGLWRVNKLGAMNVPWNKSSKIRTPTASELMNAHKTLVSTKAYIFNSSFEEVIRPQDDLSRAVVYLDPPYLGGFVAYTADGWDEADAEELFLRCLDWSARGAQVILSHSDTETFRKLASHHWPEADVIELGVRRPINSDGKKRGKVPEVLLVSPGFISKSGVRVA